MATSPPMMASQINKAQPEKGGCEGGKMKKAFQKVFAWIAFLIGGYGAVAEQAQDAGIIDFSGQGKNRKEEQK